MRILARIACKSWNFQGILQFRNVTAVISDNCPVQIHEAPGICEIRKRNTCNFWMIQIYFGPIDFAICKHNPLYFMRIRTGFLVRILEVQFLKRCFAVRDRGVAYSDRLMKDQTWINTQRRPNNSYQLVTVKKQISNFGKLFSVIGR